MYQMHCLEAFLGWLCMNKGMTGCLCCQDGAHGHQRQRQVQLPPDVLQQGGVAPELAEPDSASFASGAGDAVLLTSTGDDDMIDAQATVHLPSTGMRYGNLYICASHD